MRRTALQVSVLALVAIVAVAMYWWTGQQRNIEERNAMIPSDGHSGGENLAPSRITAPLATLARTHELTAGITEPKLKSFRESEYSKNKPISVYGRVVDQHDQPVPGATLTVGLAYVPYLVVPGVGWSSKTTNVVSDENGEFSIENQTGVYIAFDAAEKSGYQFGNINGFSVYAGSSKNASTPTNRLIIHAWKIEATKTKVLQGSTSILVNPEGNFVSIDFDQALNEKEVLPGPPQGDLYVSVLKGPKDSEGRYDWTVRLRAVDGGIQEHGHADNFAYLAPEGGYLPEWTETMLKSSGLPLMKSFFLKSRNGNRYSEITVDVYSGWHGGKPLVSVFYVTNLDGAREVPRHSQ